MPGVDAERLKKVTPRLDKETNIWLATVRADGRPHLIPIWFVWYENRVYMCGDAGGQKFVNAAATGKAAVALEDGDHPVIIEGSAEVVEDAKTVDDGLAAAFIDKYAWDIRKPDRVRSLIVVTPEKLFNW